MLQVPILLKHIDIGGEVEELESVATAETYHIVVETSDGFILNTRKQIE